MAANQVEIEVIAKDLASQALNTVVNSLKGLGTTAGLMAAGFVTAGVAVGGALLKMGQEAVSYADDVRKVQQVTGDTAEESSRLIQVLDDLKVGTESVDAVTRALAQKGMALSIDTLAKLSDQYLALSTQQERNKFIVDNLGRSGLQYVEVLQQGSTRLHEMNGEVEKGLILSQKQVDAARENQKQVDALNDRFQALKVTIGNQVVPVENDLLQATLDSNAAQEQAIALYGHALTAFDPRLIKLREDIVATREAKDAVLLHSEAMRENTTTLAGNADALALDKEALKAVTEANNTALSTITNVQSENDSYAKSLDDLNKKHAEEQAEIDKLLAQGWSPLSDKVQEVQKRYDDTGKAIDGLAAQHDQAMKRIVYDLFVAKLQADGFTDSEFQMALQAGEALGVIDPATAQMALGFNTVAQAAAAGKIKVSELGDAAKAVVGEYNIDLYINAYGDTSLIDALKTQNKATGGPGSNKGAKKPTAFASGGSFIVPSAYGNEGFNLGGMATASAGERVTVSPSGAGGSIIFNFPNYIGTPQDLKNAMQQAVRQMQLDGRVPS
jgi:hypothetical protein